MRDEPDLLELTSSDINGANLYCYCGNDLINYIDNFGLKRYLIDGIYVVERLSTQQGFYLLPNIKFLSTWYCRYFLGKFFKKASNGKRKRSYKQTNDNYIQLERAAAELYFHAVAYYCFSLLKYLGISNKMINQFHKRASIFDINVEDKNANYYWLVWGSANLIKRYAPFYLRRFM